MSEEFIGFGKNDKKVLSGGRVESYRGKSNQTDRISLVWFYKDESGQYRMGEGDTPKFKMANYHYAPSLGYIASKGEYTIEKFGPPRRRLGTFVIKYTTDRSGNLKTGHDGKPIFDFEILQWQFGEDKYRLLATIHDEFPLTQHDIKVTCTEEQYQKLSFTACNGQALWQRSEKVREDVLLKVKEMEHQMSLCRDMSIDALKEHFNEGESVIPDASSDIDYDDLVADLE